MRLLLVMTCLWIGVMNCPAPLIYRPGEGWTYEAVGAGAAWQRKRAKDQLVVAQEAFDAGQYRLALKAAKHTTKTWPLSDSSGRAQYLIGRCYEARKMDERAFKEYQKALTKISQVGKLLRDPTTPIRDRQPLPWRTVVQTVGLHPLLSVDGPHRQAV